ncbi:MAG: hypothetical protein Q9218_002501 [Villophora microphyllina]
MGESLPTQHAKLAASIEALIKGQAAYGPAAIFGRVVDRSDNRKEYGRLSAITPTPPPPTPQDWPSSKLEGLDVPGSPGVYLEIESRSRTLDNWNREWFDAMCQALISWLSLQGGPQTPVGRFEKQGVFGEPRLWFGYGPNPYPGATPPTVQMLISALKVIREVVSHYGARLMVFQLRENDDDPITLGSGQFRFSILNEGDVGIEGNLTVSGDESRANDT